MQSNKLDTYWRLPDRSGETAQSLRKRLEEAGYQHFQHTQKIRLLGLHGRLDGVILSYYQFSREGLVDLTKARGIIAASQKPTASTANTLIRLLETYDGERRFEKFEKFTDLPAEMRNRIYEMYLNEFDEVLDCPAQPPLARANRQLRAEVLPLFYSMETFLFRCVIKESGFKTTTCGWSLSLSPMAYAFVTSLCTKYTSKMGCIEFSMWSPREDNEFEQLLTAFRLRKKGEEGYTFETFWQNEGEEMKSWIVGCPGSVAKTLGEVLDQAALDSGEFRIRPRDIFAMRNAIEKGMFSKSGADSIPEDVSGA